MISNLKKVTIALEGVANATASSMPAENGNGDDEEYEGTSFELVFIGYQLPGFTSSEVRPVHIN